MSEDANRNEEDSSTTGSSSERPAQGRDNPEQSGPKFTQGTDPLAGIKNRASDVLESMEGKTVSMKVYVGSIIAVVVLMMLARCGG